MAEEKTIDFLKKYFNQPSISQIVENLKLFNANDNILDSQLAIVMVLDYIYSSFTEEQARQLITDYYKVADEVVTTQIQTRGK